MSPTQQEGSKTPEWLTKTDAAARLGLSPVRILAMAKTGELRSKRERDPASNQMAVFLHAVDVEREAYLRQHPDERPEKTAEKPAETRVVARASEPKNDEVLALLARVLQQPREPELEIYITIAEAARYQGLPVRVVKDAIKEGKLPVKNVGLNKERLVVRVNGTQAAAVRAFLARDVDKA